MLVSPVVPTDRRAVTARRAQAQAPAPEVTRLRRRFERERQARLDAEAIAEKGLRELYERQQQLEVLEKIATAANETTSIGDALQFAISTVCHYTDGSWGTPTSASGLGPH